MRAIALMTYVEIDVVCILTIFYILVKSFHNFERRESWRFYQCALCFIISILTTDLIWELMEFNIIPYVHPMPYIVNFVYFVVTVLASVFWYFFTEAELEIFHFRNIYYHMCIALPAIAMLGLLVINYFNGCLFYFDADGRYIRGPLNIFTFIIPMAYLIVSTIHPLIRIFQKKYYIQRKQYFYLALFPFMSVFASSLQILFQGTPLPCISMTAASLLVYINSQELLISIDPLTKLNNRHNMIRYLSHRMEHFEKETALYLLILDLDRFKLVNDTYGHVEGDQALTRFATVLRQTASIYNCYISRYGGDEFIIIYETKDEEGIESLCNYIHTNLEESNKAAGKKYKLSTSIGYAKYSENIQYVPEFIALADKSLYEVKMKHTKHI